MHPIGTRVSVLDSLEEPPRVIGTVIGHGWLHNPSTHPVVLVEIDGAWVGKVYVNVITCDPSVLAKVTV